MMKKRWAVFAALIIVSTLVLAACQPKTVIVEKIQTKVVEVEKQVEVVVTANGGQLLTDTPVVWW